MDDQPPHGGMPIILRPIRRVCEEAHTRTVLFSEARTASWPPIFVTDVSGLGDRAQPPENAAESHPKQRLLQRPPQPNGRRQEQAERQARRRAHHPAASK